MRPSRIRSTIWALVGLVSAGVLAAACDTSPMTLTVSLGAASDGYPISPYIYGVSASGGARPHYQDMGVSVVRWGGNARSRFNWEINASNTGADSGFRNVAKGNGSAGSAALDFHVANVAAGAESLLTIPMIGWVARDGNEQSRSVDVPITRASKTLDGYDPSRNRDRTSIASLARKRDRFEYPPDLADGAVYQDEWVYFLTQSLGPSEAGGIRFYEMDNEPMLWSETHVDVQPIPTGYDDYFATFTDHADAVKDIDPTAQILAPSVWGWTAYFYSASDDVGNTDSAPDRRTYSGVPFLPWFLAKVREYDTDRGRRSLDFLAIHYFPQGGVYSDRIDEEDQVKRLRSTRSLWDPTYEDESWVSGTADGPYVRLIPRMREWIDRYYPGTKLAITEWNWGAEDHITGGLAVADALGIFGREGVDLATHWGEPRKGSPVYWAFRMFRNYDSLGHGFGDLAIATKSSEPDLVTAYASIATDSNQLKLLLINKSPENVAKVQIDLAGYDFASEISVFQYSGGSLQAILELPSLTWDGSRISYELPPYSITLMSGDLQHVRRP